jgi:C-terminal processing protease CtpA/Prc
MQWTKPVAVVISADCYSACEIFVAAMAHDPQHFIVGRYPTAGVEAGIGFFKLPGDISLQAPVDQLRYPETGEIFLEGVGVPPNVKVPATAETLLSKDDQELAATEKILLKAR